MRRRFLLALLMALTTFLAVGGFAIADNGLPDCSDSLDNDGDGFIDFSGGDPGCSSDTDNREVSGANVCDNGLDDDGDDLKDFGGGDNSPTEPDPGCTSPTDSDETDEGGGGGTECSDGLDNDEDDAVDLDDDDCENAADEHEGGTDQPECDDGIDNDGDGFIDGDDSDENETDEDDEPEDNDGAEDGADEPENPDPDCEDEADDSEQGHEAAECNDGINNDPLEDDLIDFADDGDDDGEEGQQDDGDPHCDSVDDDLEHSEDGNPCPPGDSTISGTKWDDLNGDGDRDDGEPGLADVTIRAARTEPAEPTAVCETHTTEDGSYSLTVPAGTYTVCEVLPSGRTQTFPTEGPVCDEVTGAGTFGHEVTVAAGEESSGNDFGNTLEDGAACSDGVDNDEDGFEDARDPGCYIGFDMSDPANYDPNDDDETNPTCAEDLDEDGTQHGPSNLEGDETGLVSGIVHALDALGPIPPITGDGSIVADTVNCGIVVGVLGL